METQHPIHRARPRTLDNFTIYAIPGFRAGVLYCGHETTVSHREKRLLTGGRLDLLHVTCGLITRDENGNTSYTAYWHRFMNVEGEQITVHFQNTIEELLKEVPMENVLAQFYFASRNNDEEISEEFISEKFAEWGVYEALISQREKTFNDLIDAHKPAKNS